MEGWCLLKHLGGKKCSDDVPPSSIKLKIHYANIIPGCCLPHCGKVIPSGMFSHNLRVIIIQTAEAVVSDSIRGTNTPRWQQHFRELDGSSRKPGKAYHNSIYTFSAFTKTIKPAFLLLARRQMGGWAFMMLCFFQYRCHTFIQKYNYSSCSGDRRCLLYYYIYSEKTV